MVDERLMEMQKELIRDNNRSVLGIPRHLFYFFYVVVENCKPQCLLHTGRHFFLVKYISCSSSNLRRPGIFLHSKGHKLRYWYFCLLLLLGNIYQKYIIINGTMVVLYCMMVSGDGRTPPPSASFSVYLTLSVPPVSLLLTTLATQLT